MFYVAHGVMRDILLHARHIVSCVTYFIRHTFFMRHIVSWDTCVHTPHVVICGVWVNAPQMKQWVTFFLQTRQIFLKNSNICGVWIHAPHIPSTLSLKNLNFFPPFSPTFSLYKLHFSHIFSSPLSIFSYSLPTFFSPLPLLHYFPPLHFHSSYLISHLTNYT